MRVLVTFASRHSATAGTAEALAAVLTLEGYYRDWDEVRRWAEEIADALAS